MTTRHKIDLNLLESLHVLLTERNVTRAAKKVGITQPALSAQLRRLRDAFDDPLLVKAESGRGMVLTPRAQHMARTLHSVMETLNALSAGDAGLRDEKPMRTFRIAANDYALHLITREIVARSATASDRFKTVFTAPRYPSTGDALEDGEIDLLIDADRNIPSGLRSRVIVRDEFVMAQRKRHPRGKRKLDTDTYCSLKHIVVATLRENLRGHLESTLTELGREREVISVAESFATVPSVIAGTDFVSTLPSLIFKSHRSTLDTFQLPFKSPTYQLSMAWHPRSDKDEALRALREMISEVLAAHVADD